ncbi:OppA family ABC transporter substrate-binding lipoprotein [Metamycoplasma spumans]|uniref:OppA family ABC transporter substrate-binding lipoprotein n=1 Tax=Metamycoplasma spumans TaxID=92406 RepID=UPI0034DD91B8
MKNKAKLWLLASGALTAAGVPALLAASCKVVPAYEKNEFVAEYNAELTTRPFYWDASRSYGAYVEGSFTYLTGGELFRIKAVKPAVIKSVYLTSTKKTESLVTQPTLAKYQLGLAQAVVLTLKNGTTKVFDNDDAEVVVPEPDQVLNDGPVNERYFSNPNHFLTSNNERSINSIAFTEALNNATKLQVVVKEGVKWVDNKGEETQYEVVPKDFYYSWIRTLHNNEEDRHSHGGTTELDALFKKDISKSANNVFTDKESYNNEYLFKVFGVDSDKFDEESTFLTNVEAGVESYAGKQALTFEALANADAKFKEFAQSTLFGRDMTFMPAPSQFIDAMNESKNQPLYTETDELLSGAEAAEYLQELNKLPADSKAYKAGTYWYGTSLKSTLFSGAYYGKGRLASSESIAKNMHSWDKEFVNRTDTINTITNLYQQKAVDAKEFTNSIFLKYEQGTLSQISYTQLTDSQKEKVSKEALSYGFRLFKKLNAKNPYYRLASNPFVNNRVKDLKYNYAFNEAYAQLVFGTSIEDLKADKQNRDSYVSGLGLSFRTILNAAINWDVVVGEMTGGVSKAWVAKVADGSSIGGSDQQTSKYKNPADADDLVNALSAVDKDGNIIDFGQFGREINPSENAKVNADKANIAEKLKSAGWDILKEKMAELLAEFDRQHPSLADEKIEFSYFFPYSNAPDKYLVAYEAFSKVVSELNPRIKLTVRTFNNIADPKVKDEFVAWRQDGLAGTNMVAWSYDYDSIGSGYDGLSWTGNLIPTLVRLSRLEETSAFAKAFPKVYELAKGVVDYEKQHEFVSSIPFDKLDKASGYYYTRGIYRYLSYKMKVNETTGFYELDLLDVEKEQEVEENGNKVKKTVTVKQPQAYKPESGKHVVDPYEWSSIFWLNYVSGKTNEYLVGLMQELSSYLNVNFTTEMNRSKEEFIRVLINKNYVTPILSGADATPYQDWIIKK